VTVLTTVRTARKQRRCDSCRHPILPGQKYVRHFIPPGDSDIGNTACSVYVEHSPPGACLWDDLRYQDEPEPPDA
jgi:hypothetical protein